VRGFWDLIVACKGSVVVAWHRGSVRTGLVGVLAAVAMVGAVGALWLVAGDDGVGRDAAAPADRTAAPDRRSPDDDAAGRGRAEASERMRRGLPGRGAWSTQAMEKAAAVSGAPGAGSRVPGSDFGHADPGPEPQTAGASSGPRSAPPAVSPERGGSPTTSTPAPTSPAPSDPPAGGATTTTTAVPPPDGTGAGDGAGGLLGGLLDVLGLG
jgi:hypothetical protein